MLYVPHLKGLTSRISKIYLSWKSNDPTGSYHIFAFEWPKWPNSTSDNRNGHVIHQIEANEPRITIKIVLAENFDRESKYTEKINFLKIFTDDVIASSPGQKCSGTSNPVIRGQNKSVLCNFIMGRLSLSWNSFMVTCQSRRFFERTENYNCCTK